MKSVAFLITALLPSASVAESFSCDDASAFYHYAIFTAEALGAVTGSCSESLTQPACRALLNAVEANGDNIEKATLGSAGDYLTYLKQQCPNHLPENPGDF